MDAAWQTEPRDSSQGSYELGAACLQAVADGQARQQAGSDTGSMADLHKAYGYAKEQLACAGCMEAISV